MRKFLVFLVRTSLALVLFVALTLGAAYILHQELGEWGETKSALSDPVILEFPRGTSLAQLDQKLLDLGVTKGRKYYFYAWTRLFGEYRRFQAGTYRLEGRLSPRDVAEQISAGKIYQPIVLRYTIPEGFTVEQIVARLAAKGLGNAEELSDLVKDKKFLRSLKVPGETLEGYFYPATYSFTEVPSPQEAIKKGVATFWEKLPSGYEAKIKELGLNLSEAVTFASLIELETALDEEKPLVAEVIWRRIKKGLPLGIDAAIIYGIEDYQGDIKRRHLKDAKNPYNTRIHKGLPPTPIGSPSLSSFEAVLSPSDLGYLYFVVDAKDFKRHIFAKTFKEHSKNVRAYVRARKKARRK